MARLNLETANTIVTAALQKARAMHTSPLAVAVLDETGQLKSFQREDETSLMRADVAIGKAWGALGMGRSSRVLGNLAAQRPHFVQALTVVAQGRLVPVPGGVLIQDASKSIIGAVGISGDTSDIDEECAVAGIEAAGLTADTGVPS
jgi:uncharacterized protein GlcG (DUF336 family)